MGFLLAIMIVIVFARKFFAVGYQMGNNDNAIRIRDQFDQVRTPEDFEQMMKCYRQFYMKEEMEVERNYDPRIKRNF